jgi:UvrD-like helicase C-terminal domain
MHYARNYAEGDVVHFSTNQRGQGIARGTYLTVDSVHRLANTLTLRTSVGTQIERSPINWKGTQVYNWEDRILAVGDRLQFRIPDKPHNIANGEFATITELNDQQVNLRFDSKRELELPLGKLRHADYAYAVTSHSSQGATVDRVIVNADSMRSANLVNQKQLYVSISRAREDAQVFTDDLDTLRRAAGRNPIKKVALEVVKPAPVTTELQPAQVLQTTQPPQRRTTSIGMRP